MPLVPFFQIPCTTSVRGIIIAPKNINVEHQQPLIKTKIQPQSEDNFGELRTSSCAGPEAMAQAPEAHLR